MDQRAVARYLERIGAERPKRPDAGSLRELHVAHLLTVPFENLSIHLGEPIVLEEAALVDKIVERRRGGFCYELNGAFAGLLSALGFDVSLLAARSFMGDTLGPPYDHLVLEVHTPQPWLADVGFGSHTMYPLRLDDAGRQADPAGNFLVVGADHDDIDVEKDGEAQCRIERRHRVLADFEATSWWHQTSPASHFTRSLICSRATRTGRISLSDHRLIRTVDGVRDEEVLTSDDEVLAAYEQHFGIVLAHLPRVAEGVA